MEKGVAFGLPALITAYRADGSRGLHPVAGTLSGRQARAGGLAEDPVRSRPSGTGLRQLGPLLYWFCLTDKAREHLPAGFRGLEQKYSDPQ